MTPWDRASGVWPRRVQNSFCKNTVMLHIKLKVTQRRIQWCKNFAPDACLGVTRGQKVGFKGLFFLFWFFFYCHQAPLRFFS